MTQPWYERSYRRMLVDMHIPDWDPAFLSNYDPVKMAESYQTANLSSVMFYCQSCVGLSYWPTKVGKMHAGLHGRDIVGELLGELKARGIAGCGYYSVIFNNWAFLEHPEWRLQPVEGPADFSFGGARFGQCCPNNREYLAFVLAQIDELVGGYDLDGLFYDMTVWPTVCLCPHCRALFKEETGKEMPTVVDWLSPDWCQFQAARERWLTQFAATLTARAKATRPGISVYHNFGGAMFDWMSGVPLSSEVHHDFLGEDVYGDRLEQLVVIKLTSNLSEHRPAEFMTSRCVHVRDHVALKPYELMEMQAFAATLFSSAFLFIDAVNIDGTVNPLVYERIGRIFKETSAYEPYLGGEPVEDIAIYFSSESKMDFAENGKPISEAGMWGGAYPHLEAIRGVCRVLQQAHLPFGVITRKQLSSLDRYRVLVLPNVLRMDQEEVEAFREYVRQGGNLYASRYTSLTETRGVRHPDFLLADVFGCHFEADDLGKFTYLKPSTPEVAESIAPQDYATQFPVGGHFAPLKGSSGRMLRLARQSEGSALATLTLPYASPQRGTVFDRNWASIITAPPWEDTDHPVIVSHRFGEGRVIYSAADIESVGSEANDKLLLTLLRSLLGQSPSYTAQTHPAVWMNVVHQTENRAFLIGFLNYQAQLPAVPISFIPFTLRPPQGKRFTRLLRLPDETSVEFTVDADGVLQADGPELRVFLLLKAEYQ